MIKLACFGAGRIGQLHALNAAAHADMARHLLVEPVASLYAVPSGLISGALGAATGDADAILIALTSRSGRTGETIAFGPGWAPDWRN